VEFASPIQRFFPLTQALSAGFTLQNIPLILEIAIVIGTFHLATAYAISFVNEIRSSSYLEAFLNKLATLVLYGSMIPFGLAVAGTGLQFNELYTSTSNTPFFNQLLGVNVPVSLLAKDSLPLILGSLVALVISHPFAAYYSSHKTKKVVRAIGPGLLEIVLKPFEFFTNVLSYVRLGVLLITTYVLGSLVAGVLVYGILGVVFATFLNIMVIAMEGLIVYIQDMRLHLYEWLSKFYIGTGMPFVPLVSNGQFFSVTLGAQPILKS
jgi:V/A-type H+-transporting ATPase subunit I